MVEQTQITQNQRECIQFVKDWLQCVIREQYKQMGNDRQIHYQTVNNPSVIQIASSSTDRKGKIEQDDQSIKQGFNSTVQYIKLVQDMYLDRFCKKYSYDPLKIIQSLKDTFQWRKQTQIYESLNSFNYVQWPLVQEYFPHGYHGITKQFNPVFIQRLGQLNINKLYQITNKEDFLKRCYQSFEYSIQVRYPMLSSLYNKPINQSIIIIDLLGLKILNDHRETLQMLYTVSGISSQHYPGNTLTIYIINMPSIIKSTWDLIKTYFAYDILKTVVILDSNYLDVLSDIIDLNDIPHYLGGKCRCTKDQQPETKKKDLYQELNLYCA